MGGEWIHVNVWLSPFAIHLKLSQRCLLIGYILIKNKKFFLKSEVGGTSLMVQWLRLSAPNAGGPGSNPGQGTRSHMPWQRECLN